MQAKLEAADLALSFGPEEIIIAPGHEDRVCLRLLSRESIGTRISNSLQPAEREAQ
jgi:glutamate 5-kinase